MPNINVDVDMDEFYADDLIEELVRRVDRDRLNDNEKKMLADLIGKSQLTKEHKVRTLADRMKYETFMKNFEDITEQDLDFIIENKYQKLRKA